MFDTRLRPLIDPPLDAAAAIAARLGLSANAATLLGFAAGMMAAAAIALGATLAGLALILVSRLFDGLDGAIARRSAPTDLGGYLDITLDFVFYAAVPLAFALLDPARNALPAALLLASFYAKSAAFLAFASVAAKRGLSTTRQGKKSLYYLGGLAEGAETILVFALAAARPDWFAALAYGFAALCLVSAAARIMEAAATLRSPS